MALRMKKPKGSILYKFLFSFVAVFLIPFLILGFFIYSAAVNSFHDRIENNKEVLLRQNLKELEEQIEQVGLLGYRLYSYEQTSLFFIEQSKALEIREDIGKFESSNAFIRNMYLYYPTVDRIYSSSGATESRVFFERTFRAEGLDSDSFRNMVTEMNGMLIRRYEDACIGGTERMNMLLYVMPLSRGGSLSSGFMFCLIEEQNANAIFNGLFADCSGGIYIWNDENLLVSSPVSGLDAAKAREILEGGKRRIRADGQEYYCITAKSESQNREILAVFHRKELYSDVDTMRNSVFVLLIIVQLLGFCAAVLMSKHYYKSIKEIADILDVKVGDGTDEMASISTRARQTVNQSKMLENQVELQKQIVKERLYLKLLYGAALSGEEQKQIAQMAEASDSDTCFFVLLFSVKEDAAGERRTQHREELLERIEHFKSEIFNVVCLELVSDQQFALVVSCRKTEALSDAANELCGQLELSAVTEHAAAGLAYQSIFDIDKSFIEAGTVLKLYMNSREFLCCFDPKLAEQNMEDMNTFSQNTLLIQSILKGNYSVASEQLETIFERLADENMSYLMKRYVCFEVTNSILSALREMNIEVTYQKMYSLIEFESAEKTKALLLDLIKESAETVENTRKKEKEILLKDILAYIAENYSSYSFSIQTLALEHDMSVSYLSKFFKENVGKTFTDYLSEIRMNKAKELLTDTDLLVKDICQQVGYIDLPSFTRKFRIEVGVSPGQYRKEHMEGENK